jgi:hypothetical protein
MEQSCYKCGQLVEEGIPFCPHCAAPQIRVVVAQTAPNVAVALETATAPALPASQTVPVLALPVRWSDAVQPCALAALIASVAMVLKLMAPVIAAPGAGFLAVAFYRRRHPEIALRAASGARLGAICGFFSSGITAVLLAFRVAVLHESAAIRNELLEAIQQSAVRYSDPQFQASIDFLRSPAGLMIMLAALLVFGLIFLVLLGTLGGALGGAAFGRRGPS